MSDLSIPSTKELRAELAKRADAELKALRDKVRAEQGPCPECGADPKRIDTLMLREHRTSPRDDEGRPMLYAPYEEGTTIGRDYERRVICVNGHETVTEETTWVRP